VSIWKKKYTLEEVNKHAENTLIEHLGIEITEIGDDYIRGTMPVESRTHQPFGILHGGASVVLAETLGSIAGNNAVDKNFVCVGLEINANHLKKVTKGKVLGTAIPVHIGRSTQVWEIRINNDANETACISRLTLAVVESWKLSSCGSKKGITEI
jgi:1,4-dihydroxy-2-naphthoyl-CoA hydrolase